MARKYLIRRRSSVAVSMISATSGLIDSTSHLNGSSQGKALYNTFFTTTLNRTAPGNYIVGTCP